MGWLWALGIWQGLHDGLHSFGPAFPGLQNALMPRGRVYLVPRVAPPSMTMFSIVM